MRHTCDTARSGSEKGNTCAECHRERRAAEARGSVVPLNWTHMFEDQQRAYRAWRDATSSRPPR